MSTTFTASGHYVAIDTQALPAAQAAGMSVLSTARIVAAAIKDGLAASHTYEAARANGVAADQAAAATFAKHFGGPAR